VRPLSFRDLQVRWQTERDEVAPWHRAYPSKVYLYALMRAARAHRDWMAGLRGFPRFKAKHRSLAAFTVSDVVRLEERHLVVGKGQRIRITAPDGRQKAWRRRIRRGKGRIVSATLSQDSTGTWWASLTLERSCTHHHGQLKPEGAVGVDVGVKSLVVAATASGESVLQVDGVRHLKQLERKVRRAQRAVSRKDLHWSQTQGTYHTDGKIRRSPSAKREAARRRLARLHRKARDARVTLLHQATARLVQEAGSRGMAIAVEDLNVKGLGRRGGTYKKGINRALQEASLGELRRQLEYKTTQRLGEGWLVAVDRWYPSSKTCARCGEVRAKLSLTERTFRCANPGCGHTADRDLNAARNLAAWGEQYLQDAGTQAGDRHPGGPSEETSPLEVPSRPSERQTHPSGQACPNSDSTGATHPGGGASPEPAEAGTEMVGTLQPSAA